MWKGQERGGKGKRDKFLILPGEEQSDAVNNGSRIFKLATAIREASVSNEVTMRRERAGKMWLT